MADVENGEKSKKRTIRSFYGGGPHGLGDPDDLSLRKVEKDVLIKKKIRDKTREEKCSEEVAQFTQCCKDTGLLFFMQVFKCRKETKTMKACLERWYNDEEFNEECKKEYLNEMAHYRRTGIPLKSKKTRLQTSM